MRGLATKHTSTLFGTEDSLTPCGSASLCLGLSSHEPVDKRRRNGSKATQCSYKLEDKFAPTTCSPWCSGKRHATSQTVVRSISGLNLTPSAVTNGATSGRPTGLNTADTSISLVHITTWERLPNCSSESTAQSTQLPPTGSTVVRYAYITSSLRRRQRTGKVSPWLRAFACSGVKSECIL